MAITGSNLETGNDKNLAHEWIAETDNVKDIKENLSKLKSDIYNKVKNSDKKDELLGSKFTENQELFNKTLDEQFKSIDHNAESLFDTFAHLHEDELNTIIKADNATAPELLKNLGTKFETYLFNSSDMKDTFNAMKTMASDVVKFELNDLRSKINVPGNNGGNNNGNNNSSDNVFLNDRGTGGSKETKTYESTKDYIDPYKQTGYATVENDRKVENIYRDNKVKKVLERIFENEEGEEIHKRMFNINLDKEDGLAGIIIAIRGAMDSNTAGTPNALYTALIEKNILSQDGDTYKLNFARSDFADLVDGGLLKYERQGGGIDQRKKVANILSRAKRTDLDTFASLLQSKDDVVMAVKEWNNTLEMTGQNREKMEKGTTQTSLITDANVLEFLCDFNSDGEISAEYKRKNNKEQKNQGDVGVLFGQQVMFTIEQAIGVKNVELGDPKGEQLVIQNIVKNMQISDSRDEVQMLPLKTMQGDLSKCTKENLAKLINGNIDEGIVAMPEMKIFFLDAIKKINGGSKETQPDLYDTLVGKDMESLLSLYESELKLKTKLDEILTASQDPATKEMIRTEGLVRVRETVFIKIMTAIDHVEITTNDGAKTQLQAAGINKGRETHALKKEILESTIDNLINTGIHYSKSGGWRFMLGYGKEGISDSGRTKRARGVGGGVILEAGKIELAINLTAEVAEQYNHKRVINANLSKVKSAKYVGIEGGGIASISTQDRGVDVEAYAGLDRQKDPVVGINQLDKQYRAVSEEIFDITGASATTLSDKSAFRAYILQKIKAGKNEKVYGKFITNNEQHLTDNLDFMVRYMDANTFFGTEGILTKFPKANVTSSINALLDIIQSGNIESRRSDVIARLHGKIALTKLSFGVTTNALTLKSGSGGSSSNAPTPGSTSGETTGQGNTTTGNGGNESGGNESSTGSVGESRFGIAGFYIGLRLSTWKNSYVPNEAQYLFTQYETGQGIGVDYMNNPAKNLDKYGQYLIALYNDPSNRLSYTVDAGRLVLSFDPKGSNLTLAKFLNIHATSDAQKGFSLKGNILTVGNVGDMTAYTITEAKGVRRILCLGSKKLDDATRVTGDLGATTIDAMTLTEKRNIPRTQQKIINDIINQMAGDGPNKEIAKTTAAAFFDMQGKLISPANYVTTFDPKELPGQTLTTGTLTITKNTDGKYAVKLGTTPTDQLTIKYIDQGEFTAKMEEAQKIETNRKAEIGVSVIDIKNTFALPTNVSNVFVAQTESALSIFDDHQKTLYREFMEGIVDTNLDPFIDATDYSKAFDSLKKILATNKKYDELTDLKTLIEKPDLTPNEKMLIVDKFKTIFSYVLILTDGKNDGNDLASFIKLNRKNIYKTMKGPDGKPYPLTTDYRSTILDHLKGETTLKREPVDNLIGFTAFYKLDGKGRKYAMTPLGGTNVLMGSDPKQAMLDITGNDKDAAQKWFLSNLDTNKDNKTLLVEKLTTLLIKNNIHITKEDIEKNLPALLSGEVKIQDSIDSLKKINIKTNRVFYLLGECGNESLGMQIDGITISDLIVPEGSYTASGKPDKEYTAGTELGGKSHSIASKVLTQEKRVSLKHNQSNKPKSGTNSGETTDEGNITTGDGGNE